MKKSDIKHFRISSAASYINTFVGILGGLVTGWILVRYLSKNEYGTYKFIFSLSIMMVYVSSFGLSSVFSRYVPEFIEKKQSNNLKKLLFYGILIRLSAVVIIIISGLILQDYFITFFSCSQLFINSIYAIAILLFLIKVEQILGPVILGAFLEQAYIAILKIVKTVCWIIIVLWIFLFSRGGFKELVIAYIGLELFIVFLAILFAYRTLYKAFSKIFDKEKFLFPLKRMFRYGGYSYFQSSIGVFCDIAVDNMIIAHYLGMQAVAIYSFAYLLVNFLEMANPVKMLKTQISYWLVRKYSENKNANLFQKQFRFTSILTLSALLPGTVFFIFFRSEIVNLFNKSYPEVENLLIVFPIFVLAQGLQHSYAFAINVLEKVEYRFYANIFSVYNLIADIVFLHLWGIAGVVIATSSASVFTVIYYDYIWRKKIGIRPFYYVKGIVFIGINTICALLISSLLLLFLAGNLLLIVAAFVFGVVYVLMNFCFFPVCSDDLCLLERFIPDRFRFLLKFLVGVKNEKKAFID